MSSLSNLRNFRACVDLAPSGTYESARDIHSDIRDIMDFIQETLRGRGLAADNCDKAFALEAAIYGYIKDSNPELSASFIEAEGFGEHASGPAGPRIIGQIERDRDFLSAISSGSTHPS